MTEIHIDCPECGEITYPDAYTTKEQNEFVRICNGCGKFWKIIEMEEEDD